MPLFLPNDDQIGKPLPNTITDNALPLTMQRSVVHLVMCVCVCTSSPCRGIIGASLYAEVELDRNIVQAIDNGENINDTLTQVVDQVRLEMVHCCACSSHKNLLLSFFGVRAISVFAVGLNVPGLQCHHCLK